ncbi:hypothetical protein [Sphingobacterium siyangense]|uniref:HNH endonuclease n=1 Tax=Sphingobacterium siyangense TaxID=459529 RepID=UPI002FDADC04
MKNLKPYSENSFAFFETVVKKKRNEDLKDRLDLIKSDIQTKFNDYDTHFQKNILESLSEHDKFSKQQIEDFEELYSYKSATFKKLLITLSTSDNKRKMGCPYCGIGEVSTFDHYLPQSRFGAFTTHPKNLICCCGKCNPKRGNRWLDANKKRATLNLYLDILPDVQFLFVEIDIMIDKVETKFSLKNSGNINPILFSMIDSHYDRLELCDRFSENSSDIITSFVNTIKTYQNLGNFDSILKNTLEALSKDQNAFGYNHWSTILKIELIKHKDFKLLLKY